MRSALMRATMLRFAMIASTWFLHLHRTLSGRIGHFDVVLMTAGY